MRFGVLAVSVLLITSACSAPRPEKSTGFPIAGSYEIDAVFYPEKSVMKAAAVVNAHTDQSDSIIFFLHGELNIDSLFVNGVKTEFASSKEYTYYNYSLVVNRTAFSHPANNAGELELTVYYSGYFNPSRARSPSDYMRIDPDDGVLLRSFPYSIWFPVFQHGTVESYPVDFTRVSITTPKEFRALFSGEMISEEVKGDERVSVWQAMGLDYSNAQCTARKYEVLSGEGIYVYHLRNDSSRAHARDILTLAKNINNDYAENYGEPADKNTLYIMEMPKYGDISSANVTGISSEAWYNFDKATWPKILIAHELVHPYVQINLPPSNPFYAFAIEGFPSYFHLPALGKYVGDGWYEKRMLQIEKSYLAKREKGIGRRGRPLPPEAPILSLSVDNIASYKDTFVLNDRVVLFFDYLMRKTGEERFMQFSKELFARDDLDYDIFEALVLKYAPDIKDELAVWLKSTEYPAEFRLQ
ncbi:MAG: hypothetical protein GF307_12395 [candidate division Zixibacteria bacterium]|nr:hypothetical protein [candidate division Zixibacteria bacterium]